MSTASSISTQPPSPSVAPVASTPAPQSVATPVVQTQPAQPAIKPELTAAQIRSKTHRLIYVTAVIAIILALTNIILIVLIGSKTKQLTQIKQQIAVKTSDDQNLQSSIDYLTQNKTQLDNIINVLPNESRLVEFIDTIESISGENASNSSLEFSAIAPSALAQDKYLPFVVNLVTDLPNFQEYLKKLEKLPYIVEVTSIQAKTANDSGSLWEFAVAARIFVQDPFKL